MLDEPSRLFQSVCAPDEGELMLLLPRQPKVLNRQKQKEEDRDRHQNRHYPVHIPLVLPLLFLDFFWAEPASHDTHMKARNQLHRFSFSPLI